MLTHFLLRFLAEHYKTLIDLFDSREEIEKPPFPTLFSYYIVIIKSLFYLENWNFQTSLIFN